MGIVSEFKDFAANGSVMDLAVGMIIGGAFATITTSLVQDVIMPVVSALMGGNLDFANMFKVLGEVPEGTAMTYDALTEAGVPLLAYGNFITVLINFIILAFIIFMMVRAMNKMRKTEDEAPAEPTEEVVLLREISSKLGK